MLTTAIPDSPVIRFTPVPKNKKRIESIDLLRGTVMIIMAIDHVRDYFHYDAFLYDPTDLSKTNVLLFFTRWITHFCAPVFVFLAGISAYLYGVRRTRKELSYFLLTRGVWLVLVELFVMSLFRTFNPTYPYFNLQVIWAIGVSMIILSVLIYMKRSVILLISVLLIAGHNLLDTVHVHGNNLPAFFWAVLHDPKNFSFGPFYINVKYPLLPWIGIMALGYCIGRLYAIGYDSEKRRRTLLLAGISALVLFIILRSGNWYGDADRWSTQKNFLFSVLSFVNVTKYPPSLLYTLITLGPAFIFLAVSEKPLSAWASKVTVFGRVPFFYYLAHILLIHTFAMIGAFVSGYKLSDMILSSSVYNAPQLKGYGFNLPVVYLVWIGLILILYPFCKRFDRYKTARQSTHWWLSYL